MEDNKNLPAFPTMDWDQIETGQIIHSTDAPGLTKRELIATEVLQGLVSNPQLVNRQTADNKEWREDISLTATMLADALLAQLSKS